METNGLIYWIIPYDFLLWRKKWWKQQNRKLQKHYNCRLHWDDSGAYFNEGDNGYKSQPSRQQQQCQRERKSIKKSAAMPPSPTQHRTLALSTSRAHPHPTRHHSKGKGAAARRKEKRRVAKAAVVPPVFSSTLRSAAQIFVPSSSPPPHIPMVTHVVHWLQHGGFPWSPWDEMNWSVPYFY